MTNSDVRIDERKLQPILANNPFVKTFVIEGCDDISDESIRTLALSCKFISHLSIRESKFIEGTPIWEMHSLSTLILVDCPRIKSEEAALGLSKMSYLTYLNICKFYMIQTGINGSRMQWFVTSPTPQILKA